MAEVNENDIAIVGMAIRVPGAATPEEYWANLSAGVESLAKLTDAELAARGVSAATLADPHYVKAAMRLQGIEKFDPEFFGFSAKEAAILDPQHRQFYEVCWEALERAGHPPARFDGAIGVFAGCGMGAYFMNNLLSNPSLVDSVGLFLLRHTGNDKDFLATRVSYAFDLKGPSVNVQTACSTSLVAAHMAVQSLLSGESDMALAGGVTIELPHGVGYHYREGEILSPDGHCRAFDHRSKGTVFGSGAGVVVLRRLADALRDGDRVHAVIKGSAVNNDGSGKVGYLAPSVDGQSAAIAEALAVADVTADTVTYVECHGTGTPVGDPIEIAALTRAFRETTQSVGYCKVGSVKSNIGHLDTAAGVASLIKAVLALEHRQIPPSLNFEAPNPAIAFDGSPFVVASALADWERGDAPRRAGINSLGVGGTNAFMVVEEAPQAMPADDDDAPHMLVLSARNRKALDDAGKRLSSWLRSDDRQSLADVAHTLLMRRHRFDHCRVLASASREEAAGLLEGGDARRVFDHAEKLDRPSIAFMYPGGGAQYFQMGRGLYERETVFREHIDRGLDLLVSRFGADLRRVFFADAAAREQIVKELAKPSVQLPLTFLVEYALTRLWEHYGVVPTAVIGHSMGENTAACIAGVFSFEDALGLVLLRGQLMDEVPSGGMLSVSMPAGDLAELLGKDLDLAAANSPHLSVASGAVDKLDALAARLTAMNVESQRVRINIAAHSRLLDGIMERFRHYLERIKIHEPRIGIISNRTGKWLDPSTARTPRYWVEHLRNTILFADGVASLLKAPERVFLEVGPGNTLGSFVRQNPDAATQRVFASMRHPEDPVADDVYFRTVMGRLWALGVNLDTDKLWKGKRRALAALPTYPFQHSAYWIEPGVGTNARESEVARPMRLADPADWFKEPRWIQQGILDASDRPCTWLVFHGREPLGQSLVQRLREAGNKVITVEPGDMFARIGEQQYTIAPEAGGVGYQELVDALADADLLPDRIFHGWLLTSDESFRPGSSFFHRNQEHGFYSLFHLARALSKAGATERPLQIVVVANGVQSVAGEPLEHAAKATVLGACAVIPREFPQVACKFVDVDLDAAASSRNKKQQAAAARLFESLTEELFTELQAAPETAVLAWRNHVRWQRHVRPQSRVQGQATSKLRRGGVYMITGGLGGIGGVIAEWLAREYEAKLVLVGRTPLPKREHWNEWLDEHDADDSIGRAIRKLLDLESLGAQVLPLVGDVTVAERMRELVAEARQSCGEISGVFHAAGVIRDTLIPLKSQRDIEEVFAAKVYGTLVLDEVFRDSSLDFMLLFSSTSAYVAPQGQIDYVGANSFLNAFADSCRANRPYAVIALNWGIWRDVGMASPPPSSVQAISVDREVAQASALPTKYPLFRERYASRDGVAQLQILMGSLSTKDHWIVDEHRLANNEALLPGTGYLELIRAALAELGDHGPWQVGNLVFHSPLFVKDGVTRGFCVRLRGGERRWDVDVLVENPASGGDPHWQRCVTARIVRGNSTAPDVPLREIERRCTVSTEMAGGTASALRTTQEAHLKFGPRWRVLKRLDVGAGEALARLKLSVGSEGDLADYALHPGLLDIATGCAMKLIPGYADEEVAQNLWVPISYRGFEYRAPLTSEVVSWLRVSADSSQSGGYAAFDVVLMDPNGGILAMVDHLTLRRLNGGLQSGAAAAPTVAADGSEVTDARTKKLSPGELALKHNLSQGIDVTNGINALARVLSGVMPTQVIVSSMDPAALIAQAESISRAAQQASPDAKFARPDLDSEFAPPRDDIEKGLVDLWGKLLGVDEIGIRDNFFDLGGHSLIAVRLFNEISDRHGADLPMSVLMQKPTIEGLAELVRGRAYSADDALSEAPAASAAKEDLRHRYVVPMHSGPVGGSTPLFVVAGMFGNVLNLSHLAHLLGQERPFYALQARGLYGDTPPHETFEEMAADYIAEMRTVQPHGPYLLGGFSGGGIAAYEMARQLIAQGERVAVLVLLDTPLPEIATFSRADRAQMLWQRIREGGPLYLPKKVWEKSVRIQRRLFGLDKVVPASNGAGARFQSQRIGDAFLRAVRRYEMPSVPVEVSLYRPKLKPRYRLSGNRVVNADHRYIYDDNGWARYVADVTVNEVPGDHDSMVLEPNVRVLVSILRRAVQSAEEKADRELSAAFAARSIVASPEVAVARQEARPQKQVPGRSQATG
jgi:acyl transferase domain-containing protein/thioesterase domain-containing protein/acyl carrier protein